MQSSTRKSTLLLLLILSSTSFILGQKTPTSSVEGARNIIQKVDDNQQGTSNTSLTKMSIIRPRYTRAITLKGWSLGKDYFMAYVTSPAREKGQVTLKVKQEMWQYTPSIHRMIKLPPSMMSQGFMGSDYSNDDMVKQSSIVDDYQHTLEGEEQIDGHTCYKIKMIPHPSANIVWNQVYYWVDVKDFVVRKSTYYDEDNILVRTILGKKVRRFDQHSIATYIEIIPADEPTHKTVVETLEMRFNVGIKKRFFSQQQMKRVR